MSFLRVKLPKSPTTAEVTQAAGNKLNEALKEASDRKIPVLFLLSGGSALALLDHVDIENISSNTTIGVLDERYSQDPSENNFAQVISKLFYKRAEEKGAQFIDTRVQNSETQDQLAERFNNSLLNWFRDNPDGTIIATVGMGPDGHTSGIMPFPENPDKFNKLFDNGNTNELVTAYDATGKNQYTARITTNMNFIRKIDTAIAYVVKEDKKPALESLIAEEGSLATTPARILKEIDGNVYLFTDLA